MLCALPRIAPSRFCCPNMSPRSRRNLRSNLATISMAKCVGSGKLRVMRLALGISWYAIRGKLPQNHGLHVDVDAQRKASQFSHVDISRGWPVGRWWFLSPV